METAKLQKDLHKEMVNALIHGIGILFCIATIPVLSSVGARTGNVAGVVGATIYAFSLMMVFTFSTLYHSIQNATLKSILRIWDHISIYFLIAGTYTPLLLVYMLNPFGITLLSVLWTLVLLGIAFKIFFANRRLLSTIIYAAMGWILLVGGKTFFITFPFPIIVMIIVGGGLYTLGCVFYLNKKIPYNHAIWHLFVLLAAICHYVAILLTIIINGRV